MGGCYAWRTSTGGWGDSRESNKGEGGIDDDDKVLRMFLGEQEEQDHRTHVNVRMHSHPRAALVRVPLGDPTRAQTPQRIEMAKAQGPAIPDGGWIKESGDDDVMVKGGEEQAAT